MAEHAFPLHVAQADGPWRRRRGTLVHATPWLEVWQDEVVRPDGVDGRYDHVAVPDSATVVAQERGAVLLTRQWIYTHGGTQWRLPGGRVEAGDASPRDAARRELAEETGVVAADWELLGVVQGADSVTNHRDHVYLARDLSFGRPAPEPGEADLTLHWLPFERALALVTDGEIRHAASVVALLFLAVRGGAPG